MHIFEIIFFLGFELFLMFSMTSVAYFGAFLRAVAQKQMTTSDAKHSPPASSTLVARRAENLGFSSLRDISHFTSRFDGPYVWRFYAPDFVILVHHVLTSYVKLRMKIHIIYPCRK